MLTLAHAINLLAFTFWTGEEMGGDPAVPIADAQMGADNDIFWQALALSAPLADAMLSECPIGGYRARHSALEKQEMATLSASGSSSCTCDEVACEWACAFHQPGWSQCTDHRTRLPSATQNPVYRPPPHKSFISSADQRQRLLAGKS